MRKENRKPTYRTWAVFLVALSLLLGLMLVPALTALNRSRQIYREIRVNQEQFQTTRDVFEALGRNVLSISITIREFLLDNSAEASRTYLARLHSNREQLQSSIAQLRANLPPGKTGVLQKLERELDAYWATIVPVLRWTPRERAERGAYFLREEQRPRRQSILAIAEELADLNLALYRQQQLRINESERRFRGDLNRSVMYALLAGAAISAAGVLRIRWLERRAHHQHELSEQHAEEMRNLSTRLRHAQEDERLAISRELHDEVGQKLTAMRMELGSLERLRTGDAGTFAAALSQVKGLAEESLRTIRDIAAGLRPTVLDDLGLGPALQKQAREFSKLTDIPVSVTVEGEFAGLTDRQRTYIYRIVQEALTNCAKHAAARQVNIRLIDGKGWMELAVSDDGAGFDPATVAHSGLGLIGIEERARELGGAMKIQSSQGQGTTISMRIPRNGSQA